MYSIQSDGSLKYDDGFVFTPATTAAVLSAAASAYKAATPAPSPSPAPSPAPAPCRTWDISLADAMDLHYGAGNWTKRTGVGVGTDIGPALVRAITAIRASHGRGIIAIPPGSWLMNTTPTLDQWAGMRVVGAGSQASMLVYNADTGAALGSSGAGGFSGGGVEGIALLLEAGRPASQAVGILLQGDATYQPDQMQFRDIYMTSFGDSHWMDGFKVYGNARTSPQGVRVMDVNNLQVFRCHNTGVYLSNLVQATLRNVGIYAGRNGGMNLYLTGGTAPATRSTQVYADGLAVSGEVNVTNCSFFKLSGKSASVAVNTDTSYGDLNFLSATRTGQPGSAVTITV